MAIAWSPATPAPRTSTFAGGIVPAAVVSMGKNLPSVLGGEEDRLVAGDRALRGERVHRLRAGDARDRVHRERRDAALGERPGGLAVGQRLEERDERLAVAEARDLVGGRPLHLADDVRLGVDAPRRGHDPRARVRVVGVGEARPARRPPLDEHLDAGLREPARACPERGRRGVSPGRVSFGTPSFMVGGSLSTQGSCPAGTCPGVCPQSFSTRVDSLAADDAAPHARPVEKDLAGV